VPAVFARRESEDRGDLVPMLGGEEKDQRRQ
jgi:hypothetical protein